MSQITPESLNKVMDDFVSAYLRLKGTSTAAYGVDEPDGAFGAALQGEGIRDFIVETGDTDVMSHLLTPSTSFKNRLSSLAIFAREGRSFVDSLNRHFRLQANANYTNLETYLRRFNTGESTKWQNLMAPEWSAIYNAIKGSRPEEYNCYFEVLQGSTYTNAVGKFVASGAGTGTFFDGEAIDSTYYCGGIPVIVVSGLTGSGVVTVTGNFYDPATKALDTNKTMLFTVSANGRWYRDTGSPGTAATDALMVNVTNITIAAGISAGTIYVEAERPALRSGTCGADVVSNTTVGLDDSASSITDFYVGYEIAVNSDNYAAKRTITGYNGTTKVVTVGSNWATNPTASVSKFRIFRPILPTT